MPRRLLTVLLTVTVLVAVWPLPTAGGWEVDGTTLRVPEAGCAVDAPGEDWQWSPAPPPEEHSLLFSCQRPDPPENFLLLIQPRAGRELNQETVTLLADAVGKWLMPDEVATHVHSVEASYAPWEGSWQMRIRATHRRSGSEAWIIGYVGDTARFVYLLLAMSDAPDERFGFARFVQSFRLVDAPPLPRDTRDPQPGPASGTGNGSAMGGTGSAGGTPTTSGVRVTVEEFDHSDDAAADRTGETVLGIVILLAAFGLAVGATAGFPRTLRLNPGLAGMLAVLAVTGMRVLLERTQAHPAVSFSAVLEPLLPELAVAVVLLVIGGTLIPRYRTWRGPTPTSGPTGSRPSGPSARPGFDTATIQSATGFGDARPPVASAGHARPAPTPGPPPPPSAVPTVEPAPYESDFRPPRMVGHLGDASSIDPLPPAGDTGQSSSSSSSSASDNPPPDDDDIANAPGF